MNTSNRLRRDEYGIDRDEDSEAYLNIRDKKDVQRKVLRYLQSAEQYLDNVCEGRFP